MIGQRACLVTSILFWLLMSHSVVGQTLSNVLVSGFVSYERNDGTLEITLAEEDAFIYLGLNQERALSFTNPGTVSAQWARALIAKEKASIRFVSSRDQEKDPRRILKPGIGMTRCVAEPFERDAERTAYGLMCLAYTKEQEYRDENGIVQWEIKMIVSIPSGNVVDRFFSRTIDADNRVLFVWVE